MCSNNLEPVQRSEDGCDVRTFRSFNYSTCKTVLHKTVQENTHKKGKQRKIQETKLLWFSRLLRHSATMGKMVVILHSHSFSFVLDTCVAKRFRRRFLNTLPSIAEG